MQIRTIHWSQLLSGVAIGIVVTLGFITLSNQTRPAPIKILPPPTSTPVQPTSTPEPLSVYVNGAVLQPDIYELPFDARVGDAIEAAGGFSAEAFKDGVNLAEPLYDGMQVYVVDEENAEQLEQGLFFGGVISAEEPTQPDSSPSGAIDANGVVNINRATRAEFETLPGIGEATAQKIVAYREDNGPFSSIEEIMNVSGIGEGKFENIQQLITIEDQ